MSENFYCVKCRKKVDVENYQKTSFKGKGGMRNAITGKCPVCGTKVVKFVKG